MKTILIFPPCFDPSMPYIAPYLLASYINEFFNKDMIAVLDLNIHFYNDVCKNEYSSLRFEKDLFKLINKVYHLENNMQKEMSNYSNYHNVTLTRQNLGFDFDRVKSDEVFDYVISDSCFSDHITQLINYKLNEKYEVYGFSINCQDQLVPSMILAKFIREINPSAKIILGGNIISRTYKTLSKSKLTRFFDYLIIKEGEFPFCNLINYLISGKQIERLKANSIFSVSENKIIDEINNINILPLNDICHIDFGNINDELYFSPVLVLPIFLSRGCSWGNCKFCGISDSWCVKYRTRTPEKVCDEIECYINKYNCGYFRFVDESPALDDLLKLAEEIIKRNIKVNIEVYLNLSRKLMDEKVVQTLAKAGIKQIFFGIESISKDVLCEMNKNINKPECFNPILNNTFNSGIHNYTFFLIGYPTDNLKNEELLKDYIIHNRNIHTIAIASFIPVGGTDIVKDKQVNEALNIRYYHKGDLTNKCNYTVNGIDTSRSIQRRTNEIVKEIMRKRPDIYISSNIPYESRFYICSIFGNDFGIKYSLNHKLETRNLILSKEQEERALRSI